MPTFLVLLLAGCSSVVDAPDVAEGDLLLQAWADNWFSMYVEDTLIVEDSVSITTERSFNAEQIAFSQTLPFTAAFVLKDFKETDSGLEYIGENNQQMGDGGFIAQLTDSTGALVGVSDDSWRCLTIHKAPLDKSCESSSSPDTECTAEIVTEPSGWKAASFDDTAWPTATVWSIADVDPKDGYDEISWDGSASLIWGADLETHNTLLCRVTFE